MQNKDNHIHFRLSDDEYKHFISKVKRSGLKQSSYLRHLINGIIPKETPPPDYHSMMNELHDISNDIHQIALVANATGKMDEKRYSEYTQKLDESILKIMEDVIMPERSNQ